MNVTSVVYYSQCKGYYITNNCIIIRSRVSTHSTVENKVHVCYHNHHRIIVPIYQDLLHVNDFVLLIIVLITCCFFNNHLSKKFLTVSKIKTNTTVLHF